MKSKDRVSCAVHGMQRPVLVCQHLAPERPLPVYAVKADRSYPAQAWCESCECNRLLDKGWNDAGDYAAQWRYVCAGCFALILEVAVDVRWLPGRAPDE